MNISTTKITTRVKSTPSESGQTPKPARWTSSIAPRLNSSETKSSSNLFQGQVIISKQKVFKCHIMSKRRSMERFISSGS